VEKRGGRKARWVPKRKRQKRFLLVGEKQFFGSAGEKKKRTPLPILMNQLRERRKKRVVGERPLNLSIGKKRGEKRRETSRPPSIEVPRTIFLHQGRGKKGKSEDLTLPSCNTRGKKRWEKKEEKHQFVPPLTYS